MAIQQRRRFLLAGAALAAVVAASPLAAEDKFITVASTTSTQNSGLFEYLLPKFEKETGIKVRVIAVGTGQALAIGRRGDADVLFVHNRAAEEKFVAEGYGVDRKEVMYNDFVVIGPKSDPAKIGGGQDVLVAFNKIKDAKAPFVSRADKSGTYAAELRYWKAANIDINKVKGPWYKETGSGMGAALNTASGLNAYILSDRGTWLNFKNRGDLEILVEGDKRLFNQYGIMLVNPAKHPHVKKTYGELFVNWIASPVGQRAIADYKIKGEQLFFPNYRAG